MIPLELIKNDANTMYIAAGQLSIEILGSVIDHTLLDPTATHKRIQQLCDEANTIGSFVCVNGSRVREVNLLRVEQFDRIRGVAAVTDFPFGAGRIIKRDVDFTALTILGEADEDDTVINIGQVLDNNWAYVKKESSVFAKAVDVAEYSARRHKIGKIIQENCCLSDEQKRRATEITASVAEEFKVHMFAKTSTGYGVPKDNKTPKGATLDDVWLMYKVIRPYQERGVSIGIKAAGGIGDAPTAIKMMLAGGCFDDNLKLRENLSDIFRMGASAGKAIVDDFWNRFCF